MRLSTAFIVLASVCLFAGSAFADKQAEMDEYLNKPWSIRDLPQLSQILADVFETEPLNDTCPGEPYTLGDTYHGAIDPPGDLDWICFSCNAGDLLTIGTDVDDVLPTVDTVIELYADDCTTMLTSNDDGGPGLYSLIADFEIPATGNYYLKIRGFSATSSTGNYIAVGDCVTPAGPGFCPVGRYKASKINVNADIPDDDLVGLTTGDIVFNLSGQILTDVVIDIDMEHTWVGDLVITLTHTSDSGAVTTCNLVDRPGVPESTFGCSGDLVSDPEDKYYCGSDPTLAPLGEFDCPSVIDPACYAVAVENPGCLETLRGMDCGDGTWSLTFQDNGGGDTGYVYNWSVHLLCEGDISVEDQSWCEVKEYYR